jgi:hypothetical protein
MALNPGNLCLIDEDAVVVVAVSRMLLSSVYDP